MGSGGLLIAAHAVAVAAAGGRVLAETAAAVLVVRAATLAAEGTERAGRARGGPSAESEVVKVLPAGELSLLKWEPVVAAVVELNARIRMLTVRAVRAGVGVDLPKPLRLAGHPRPDAERWTAAAARRLAGAQAAVRHVATADEARQVAARLAHRQDTSEALAAFQEALRKRGAVKRTAATGLAISLEPGAGTGTAADSAGTPLAATVEAALVALDEDANEREHLEALSAAASVLQGSAAETPQLLESLQARVEEINAVVARRRLAVQWLAALEEPVVATVAAAGAPGAFLDTAARLSAVLEGEVDLGPDLRAEGAEAVAWAAAVTRNRFVHDLMSDCLAELGYTPASEFDVRYATEINLRLARPHWQGEHSAEVWVDQQGTVHGRVVRELESAEDDVLARERDRCTGFGTDLRTLGRRLGADVVTDEGYFPGGDYGPLHGGRPRPAVGNHPS